MLKIKNFRKALKPSICNVNIHNIFKHCIHLIKAHFMWKKTPSLVIYFHITSFLVSEVYNTVVSELQKARNKPCTTENYLRSSIKETQLPWQLTVTSQIILRSYQANTSQSRNSPHQMHRHNSLPSSFSLLPSDFCASSLTRGSYTPRCSKA